MRFINFILMIAVLAGLVIGGKWYVSTPQPARLDAKIDYAMDTAMFELDNRQQNFANPTEELAHWRPLARAGNIAAQLRAAELLFGEGQRNPKAYIEAVAYARIAADKGIPAAQNVMGVAALQGLGDVPKSNIDAYKWFDLASDRGLERAHDNVLRLATDMTTDQVLDAEHKSDTWFLDYMAK